MATAIDKIRNALKSKRIPYNYVVGGKGAASPVPFDVMVSFDPQARKTIIKATAITALGLAALGAGIYFSNK
jgi:hypothetical protein